MKRRFVVKIDCETEPDEPFALIKADILQELSCCWHHFDEIQVTEEGDATRR